MSANTRSKHSLSRRAVLRGAAGVALALPTLEAMLNGNGTALAAGSPLPKRFVVWFWGNGNDPDNWAPAATGAGWTPTYPLQSLDPLRADVSIVTGMNLPVQGYVAPHSEGPAGIMAGGNPVLHPSYPGGEGDWNYLTMPGPSVDQVVAAAFAGTTAFRSVELGVTQPHGSTGPGRAHSYISHNGPYNPNPPELDPAAVFARLFGNGIPPQTPRVDPLLAVRASVLDVVKADAKALKARLGVNDRRRLDDHLSAVYALEQRVKMVPPPPPVTCVLPQMPGNPSSPAARGKVMGELAAMALACDLTRVITLQFSSPASHETFDAYPSQLSCGGSPASFHVYQHCAGFDATVKGVLKYFVDQFAAFVQTLKSTPDVQGTLLDQCCVLGTSELAAAPNHQFQKMPLLVAGRAGGALKAGQHIAANGENPMRLMLALLQAVGVGRSTWGQDQFQTSSPLTEILA